MEDMYISLKMYDNIYEIKVVLEQVAIYLHRIYNHILVGLIFKNL